MKFGEYSIEWLSAQVNDMVAWQEKVSQSSI